MQESGSFRLTPTFQDFENLSSAVYAWLASAYLAEQASRKLLDSSYAEEQHLGRKMQDYYSKLEPVESAEQKTLRQLNEVKQQQIKRMQAMRKRLKKGSQNLEK